ncbi:MAG: type I-MYXAN CRISPR-associated protein Cas6/Cmx6 [Acidobacteria bacterium]|nr:type I-MYXAN CRISPR-associated protein Cas6/Cmx6 [Acidobacteriota bacterium]
MKDASRTWSGRDCDEKIKINVAFPLQGQRLPADHGYQLFAAVSKIISESHDLEKSEKWLGVELISGVPFDRGLIVLPTRNARLNLRIPADKFGEVIPLAGKSLDIGGHRIRLGIPTARPLQPVSSLYSRIVTFRNSMEIPKFLETAEKELAQKEIKATLELPKEGRSRQRRIITIKGKKIVGFSIIARKLSDEDSIKLQHLGLGGRRSMGCGIFNPIRKPIDFEVENYGV